MTWIMAGLAAWLVCGLIACWGWKRIADRLWP